MSCSCVVCLLCCVLLLDSSCFVAIVRIRSSTLGSSSWLHLLHGLVLLPCGISGKMTATLDLTTIIAMLVASFYRYAALPIFCSSSLPYCHEPLTFDTFPMQTVVWLCYRFCSAPLIALLVAGEVEDCSMVDRIMLGYHNISYLINASIYLVKGGRLGLMPGVLFHSCRPSFRHTGVMFPDFAFLTRLGDLWDPLDSSL